MSLLYQDLLRDRNRRHRQTHVVQNENPKQAASMGALSHQVHVEFNPGKSARRVKIMRAVSDVLAKEFLTYALKERFHKLNPDVAADLLDWRAIVPSRATFSEGVEAMRENYPHYAWEGNQGC